MPKIYLAYLVLLLFSVGNLHAQVSGCTDPLANNYNSSATLNDGSCTYDTTSASPIISVVLDSALLETSGLIKWGDHLYSHNDNTDINIYSLDTLTGAIIQAYPLTNTVNTDWEEISQDSNYVYMGDFGNNVNGNRTDLHILRILKSSLLANTPVIDTIAFSYSNQTDFTPTGTNNTDFDCESMVVSSDSIYLFTKQWVSSQTSLYVLPKTPGTYIANLKTTYNVQGLITGATYIESKRLIVLCGYTGFLQPFTYLLYDFTNHDFFSGNKRKIPITLPFHQVEGIATSNGLKYWISNEYFTQPPLVTTTQKLHTLDLSPYLAPYINGWSTHISQPGKNMDITIYPNPASSFVLVNIGSALVGNDYSITDSLGSTVLTGKLKTETNMINIAALKPGTYLLRVGKGNKQAVKLIKAD